MVDVEEDRRTKRSSVPKTGATMTLAALGAGSATNVPRVARAWAPVATHRLRLGHVSGRLAALARSVPGGRLRWKVELTLRC